MNIKIITVSSLPPFLNSLNPKKYYDLYTSVMYKSCCQAQMETYQIFLNNLNIELFVTVYCEQTLE